VTMHPLPMHRRYISGRVLRSRLTMNQPREQINVQMSDIAKDPYDN
jgi:hypothetical protein